MKQYIIALPSGSLFEATLLLFKRIGIVISFGDREFVVKVRSSNLEIIFILAPASPNGYAMSHRSGLKSACWPPSLLLE